MPGTSSVAAHYSRTSFGAPAAGCAPDLVASTLLRYRSPTDAPANGRAQASSRHRGALGAGGGTGRRVLPAERRLLEHVGGPQLDAQLAVSISHPDRRTEH